ncbi:MAG TPA: glycosyltransferase family 4 protein [Anaerohalosphaeraceae bacterium]|jgi:glycosyltransferase involved in cell wall biosynthesis|nr:glycosyltransferase family 4 protein [Anaerohalosphaeraceae bacterium]HRT50700.1 glycosyltransferase family 4 protein [Anaerohalosphaeraceae bacterium]HRT86681.1 glycosyltransferase family 4 protein [Anaerohalosphaeraceae bacterium]
MPDQKTNADPGETREPVRPAIIVDKPSLKDYAASIRHFLVGLADESFPAAIVCPPKPEMTPILAPSVEFITYPLIRLPFFGPQNRTVLLQRLDRFKPTVLHSFGAGRAPLARYLAKQLDLPYIVTFNRPASRLFKPRVHAAACSAMIASSRAIADYLRKAYPRQSLRIRQINLGTFVEDDCACFAPSHGIASFIVAQRLDTITELDPLLRAVRYLILDGHELVLAIIGAGHAEGKLHARIRALGLSQIVSVVPEIQPLRAVFAGADVFIQPRASAEFNSRLLEAMSVGLAVAASDESLDDMLIENHTAVFFDSRDELSVYECLGAILADRQKTRVLAQAGQEYLRRHYTVSRMTSALIQTYQTVQKKYRQEKNPDRPAAPRP